MRFTDTIIATVLACTAAKCRAGDFNAWQFTQSIPITSVGLTYLELPTATLNAARPMLEDLRVLSPSGRETPVIIRWPWRSQLLPLLVDTFDMRLVNHTTQLVFTTGSSDPFSAIRLEAAAPRFLKAVSIESSNDGVTWQTLITNTVIFREPGRGECLRIDLHSQRCARLRVTIDDQSSPPIAFTGAALDESMRPPPELPLSVKIAKREELGNISRLTLDLGGKNAFVASLKFGITDSLFSRFVSVFEAPEDGADVSKDEKAIADGTLFRLTAGGKTSEDVRVPVHRGIGTNKLVLDIDNGDSPALSISGIEASQHPVTVLFHVTEPGEWRLICGNALAAAPRYDTASIYRKLGSDDGNRVAAGPLTANPSYVKPAALPEVNVQGVDAALPDCRFRRPVTIPAPGVIVITLDPEVLSHAQSSLQDLRLVQEGRQIPFLLNYERGVWRSFVEPSVALTKDEKRPRTSIWTLTLPFDQLPVGRITCISGTSLFDRQVTAWTMQRDSFGNESRMRIGSAQWMQTPGDASDELELLLNSNRLPMTLTLETDNGDNPPIEIERVRVHYPKVTMLAKATNASGLFLYYGNDHAIAPTYDLRLVKAELESAPHEVGTLGAEEELKTCPPERASSSGSPWLWASLAAVVATLLWAVARMLPKADREAV